MNKPTISVFLYRNQPKRDGTCAVAIRITHQRTRRFYPTGILLKPDEFDALNESLLKGKRLTDRQKEVNKRIMAFQSRANDVADELDVFTFAMFEDLYLSNREATDSIAFGFNRYIIQLREQGRISTASSFECTKKCIEEYRSGLRYADITPEMLKRFEKWMLTPQSVKRHWKGMDHPVVMLREPLSKTTVGIYMRSLRAVINRAKINPALYPFSKNMEKGKYMIPTGRNIKKALKPDQLASMYNFPTKPGTMEDLAKDYWFFMYLCNGMNLKDVCLLKWKNKDGDTLKFIRAKTMNTNRREKAVEVYLKPIAKAIIAKWGQPSIDPNGFIFPHIQKDSTPEDVRRIVQQVNQNINKHIGRIAKAVGIDRPVTTYFARHSFATVMRNSGTSVDLLSDLLGHSTWKQTAEYLDGFEKETIEHATDALTSFLG
jgi:integrase/recombinase XerD